MPTKLRLSCRALLIIVLVEPNFYSAGPQASHQLDAARHEMACQSTEIHARSVPFIRGPAMRDVVVVVVVGFVSTIVARRQ